jgi:integrase
MKFTQSNVNKLKQSPGKTDETIWDDGLPGFGIRFRNGGAGVYVIQYSVNGRQGKMGLGKVAQVTLDAAQTEAKQQFAMIARNVDPALERSKQIAKSGEKFGEKIAVFFADLEKKGLSPGYIKDYKRNLQGYMTNLHRYGLGDITRALIAAELDKIEQEHGYRQAGLARSQIHRFYEWAFGKGLVETNPAAGTEKRDSERNTRVLTPAELIAIWNATSSDGHFDKIVRLLMLTAARGAQIGSLNRKTELKLDDRLCDFIPPHVREKSGQDSSDRGKTKNKERFWLALSNRAMAILETVPPRIGSDFVFGTGEGGFSGWSTAKERLDAKLGDKVERWTFHDFRRTFESLGIDQCKIPPWVTDVCLHHVGEHKKGIKRTYNHAHYIDEKRDAMERWGAYIDGLVAKQPKLTVVA